jgi:hypothetical protein
MTVSAAQLSELQRLAAGMPEDGGDELRALETVEELIAYIIADSRASGHDETDAVELLLRLVEMRPGEVRNAEKTMRLLGYSTVSAMMRRIAGRRTRDLTPLS